MSRFFARLRPFFLAFLFVQFWVRVTLMIRASWSEVDFSALEVASMMARGLWLDIVTAGFILIPVALVFLFTRASFWESRAGVWVNNGLRFVFLYAILFDAVAEHLFWLEFSTRFNFIAVDYLVYTTEVIGNIVESYPLPVLLAAIGVAAVLGTFIMRARSGAGAAPMSLRQRALAFGVYAALVLAGYGLSNTGQAQFNDNAAAGEIAANGIYNLFYAFWHNEINYEQFYAQRDPAAVEKEARKLLAEEGMPFENEASLVRLVKPVRPGPEIHKNVIIIVMESMSASFMRTFGNEKNLTPNLDRIAKDSLSFSHMYATGTRTVRGLEAITLSVPPTPGQSIVRRPNNANLFSLGFVFQDRGYDTKFIYGGHGYFDNMNAFFEGNGFTAIDRTDMSDEEVHFANVWGVADDDLFAKVIKEADKSYAAGKKFMSLAMTTSNHRPYTYPEGKIDIAPKQGREGGVKYADYAVGKLLEWASAKPWYKDTVFVFVADHTHGAGGKAELDPEKYHIPMMIYAPGFIKPQVYEEIASQIDTAPILLGQLNFAYRSKFYGEDLMHDADEIPHAFISNYQKVALIKNGELTVLAPKKQVDQYTWPRMETDETPEEEDVAAAIGYYQSASRWRDVFRRISTHIPR